MKEVKSPILITGGGIQFILDKKPIEFRIKHSNT